MCRKIIKGDRYLQASGYPKSFLQLSQLPCLGMDISSRGKEEYQ